MKQYFVDYENVHEDGLVGLDEIREPIVVHVFNSRMRMLSSFDSLYAGLSLYVTWRFEMADNGQRDALDIQLAGFLGFAAAKSPSDTFHIVSKDKGYDSLVTSFTRNGINVTRQINIRGDKDLAVLQDEEKGQEAVTKEICQKEVKTDEKVMTLRSMIPADICSDETITGIIEIIAKSDKVGDVCRGLSRIGGVQKGQQLYRYIKDYVHTIFEKKDMTANKLRSVLTIKNCSDENLKAIVEIIKSSTNLAQVSSKINKLFNDNKKGSAVYQKIKPKIKNLFYNKTHKS